MAFKTPTFDNRTALAKDFSHCVLTAVTLVVDVAPDSLARTKYVP